MVASCSAPARSSPATSTSKRDSAPRRMASRFVSLRIFHRLLNGRRRSMCGGYTDVEHRVTGSYAESPDQPDCVLTVNAGSSSLKVTMFGLPPAEATTRVVALEVERIGLPGSLLLVTSGGDGSASEHGIAAPDQAAALRSVLDW